MEEAAVVAEEAHDRKLLKSLELCQKEEFTLYPWPGSQQEAQLRPCMRLFASGLSWRELVEAILLELVCDRVL